MKIDREIRDPATLFVAALALAVSIWTVRDAQQARREVTAIDLSIKNLSSEIAKLRNDYDDFAVAADKATIDQRRAANAYLYYLEYVAGLINTRQIDPDFVADVLKCQIKERSRDGAFSSAPGAVPRKLPNIERFRLDYAPLACEGYDR
jgi:hypothetical protein